MPKNSIPICCPVFLLFILAFCPTPWAEEFRTGRAVEIRLDGILNEECWRNAAVIDDFTLMKASGKTTPANHTQARILSDGEALYFGIECQCQHGVMANLRGEVANAWTDDLMEFFIAPTASRDEYYQFAVTAGGAYWSQYFAEGGNIRPDPYKPGFQIANRISENGYSLEIRIPLHAFYMTPAERFADTWAINLARYDIAKPGFPATENSTWAKLSASFHEIRNFNTIGGLPRKPAKFDLLIPAASFSLRKRSGDACSGILSIDVVLNRAPAGDYTLETLGQTVPVQLKSGTNTIPIQASFPKDGRTPVKFLLKDTRGEIVCERVYPVFVDSTLYGIHFTRPQYGGNFYPGEDDTILSGTVRVNSGEEAVVLTVAEQQFMLPVSEGKAEFSVDISQIHGDIPVSVGDLSLDVKRVTEAKAWIRDGRIVVDGQTDYRLGWYGDIGWITSHATVEKYPAVSAKQPITFPQWINLEPSRLVDKAVESSEMVFDRQPSQKVLDAIQAAIEASWNAPGYVYYLSDEPECRGLSPIYLKSLYQFIKKLDPRRLVMIISREPTRFIECCDIINPHPYISPAIYEDGIRQYACSLQRLRDICASVEEFQRPDKTLMLTPQVHCYSFNDYYADYPTFDETNLSIWTSVVHGGQGVTPFIWYEHFSRPGLDLGCDFLYDSLHCLGGMISRGERKRLPGDEGACFTLDGKSLYVICNVYPTPRSFSFSTKFHKLYRFRSDEVILPQGGTVDLQLPAYGVAILTSEPLGTDLESEKAFRKRIDDAEYARCHRGNILFGQKQKIRAHYPESHPYDWQNTMEQLDKMFDGNLEVSAWMPRSLSVPDAWYELEFLDGPKEFSTARIYGYHHQNLSFRIWDGTQWTTPELQRKGNGEYELILKMDAPVSTTAIRLDFPGTDVELYEFELLGKTP